ncbi:hypothetical protein GUITHDRAFT_105373 [Guillardia theta CCMP2712]|uniref:Uncharacterized protein n=1 Tax=Guillardia theta (strain CCMP2712) TaxID=905079 RepID=L1JKS8_GUITC|nr:hypothetical protein GUITHDRAFT_105373 [Guillardia theta CCMP2712]EKX48744.1 hypothetical protein GUITHDRAFT_105373 [Guillardia theta CCMP2712]|eukprot:XP_005835724.1 hypothetical protein GUITHDRAFT_105373 [Guillardia theta CCMP2712]
MGKSPNKNLTPNLVAMFKGKKREPILVHLHFDVKAAYSEDGWKQDPFLLLHEDKRLSGRMGGKCDIVAWLSVIEVVIIFDSCFEIGSPTMQGTLEEVKEKFLKSPSAPSGDEHILQPSTLLLFSSFNPSDNIEACMLKSCRGCSTSPSP